MVWVTCAEEEPLLPKEEERWRVPNVVGFAVMCCGLPLAGGAPRSDAVVGVVADDDGVVPGHPSGDAIVRVVADDDGIVPGCPSRGAAVGVAANDDGIVPGRPDGGTPQSLAWCSML